MRHRSVAGMLTMVIVVGGADPDVLFGLMVEAACDDAGRVYLMDQQLETVTVVAADGPGEVRTPQGIAALPDGRVAVAGCTARGDALIVAGMFQVPA